jgi:YfiH family protein
MLERMISPKGVVFYRSPRLHKLGVPHGFSTRLGGVSPSPFDSLNLGNPGSCDVQDDSEHIRENYRRLMEVAGCGGRELARAHQVHAARTIWCRADEIDAAEKADGLLTSDERCVVSVRVADCVPVLIASDDGKMVAAVHAGWRGVVAGVVPASIAEMRRAGAKRLVAAVGPCIGIEAFEVGGEVIAEFERVFGADAPITRRDDGKGYVGCREGVVLQLLAAGVEEVDVTDRCTFRDQQDFYSHRRDKGITGRMAAIISPRR